MERFCVAYSSPLGILQLISNRDSLLEIRMTDEALLAADDTVPAPLQETIRWLDDYFSGKMPSPTGLPLQTTGTAFQQ